MKKIKIAITTNKMVMGGIEKCLIEMINSMHEEQYDITLFLKHNNGELINNIPKHVKKVVIFEENISNKKRIINEIKKLNIIKGFKIGFFTFLSSKTKNLAKSYKYICKTIDNIDEEFDIAISYSTPTSFSVVYTMDNIKAKKKAVWIHSDLNQYRDFLKKYENYYSKYDEIYSVSKLGCEKILNIFPNKLKSVSTFYNIISKNKIELLAKIGESFNDDYDGLRIVTVGRLSYEKGQDIIINIVKRLKIQGYNLKWYLIGDGEERINLENNIKINGLEEDIILMGNQDNPYKYIKDCDIYVQPSRQEGYCMTVAEARCLSKPMIITDFNGADEQIENMIDGIIVQREEEKIIDAIKLLINDEYLRDKFKKNLELKMVDTVDEIQKLNKLLI